MYLKKNYNHSNKFPKKLQQNFHRFQRKSKNKFNHIYLITPESSFLSVKDHPFENHAKVYYELNSDTLENIYNELVGIKKNVWKEVMKLSIHVSL